jgi:hypothetical protein
MPDLIRHPVYLLVPGLRRDDVWIAAFAGMTTLTYAVAGVITGRSIRKPSPVSEELHSACSPGEESEE